jgi:sulfur relay (sulfurtransferase) DsrC/TusE family protein
MVKVYVVYDKQGFLVDLEDWTDGEFASLLSSKLGTKLHTYMVPPFDWRPRIPRSL